MRHTIGLLVIAGTLAGCATGDLATRPLSPVERFQAELCEQLIGVERLGCIQQTAGRPGSPYDAAGRPIAATR